MIKKEVKLVLFILFNTLLPAVHADELSHEVLYSRNQRPYYRVDYIEKRLAAICTTYNLLGRRCKSGVVEKRSVLFSWISVLPQSQTPELRKWVSLYALQKLDNHAGGKPQAVQLEEIFYAKTKGPQKGWAPVLPYSSLWKDWTRQQERFYNKSCEEPEPGWEQKERNRIKAANKSRAEENRLQLHYALHGLDPETTERIQRQLKQIFPENAVHDLEPSKSYTLLLTIPGTLSDRLLLPVNESFFALDSNGHLASRSLSDL
ncbi:hypothetical protein NX722_21420 [Endozoicomonas gorgoniicola]|uniref:Uncharacterized protein n=1 Tax=Endozoicomonas gorgoniicola TaxID=1234144 RepID=A0ABT3N0I7_9GAMM|nr:hypothetical protein [Endozoicomonas gorgoniicola]MCW7555137.1 hypothetical protein [Endozoicomonas gorgoniicola]